nr:MAG TPA: hypothetical protein [Caudoviricetes sp.]
MIREKASEFAFFPKSIIHNAPCLQEDIFK